MSHTRDLNKDDFVDTVQQDGLVLVDFWAPWCGPCRTFGPIFDKVAADHPDATFAKVNTENEQELAASFQIRSIPTLMIFRDGVLLFAQPGALPEAALRDVVKQALALDMDEVKRTIAEREAQEAQG